MSPNEMPNENKIAGLEQLVSLIINQDHVANGWLKFLLTIESALVISFAYLVNFLADKDIGFHILLYCLIIAILPAFGIISIRLLNKIIIRELNWQKFWVDGIRALDSDFPRIYSSFREDEKRTESVGESPQGYISKVVNKFSISIIFFWFVIYILVVICRCIGIL